MIKQCQSIQSQESCKAFSLVEVMVSLSIAIIVFLILAILMVDSSRIMLWTSLRTDMTQNVRQFAQKMRTDTQAARHAYLYSSFQLDDCDSSADRIMDAAGDCLVLIDISQPLEVDAVKYYQRLVVYYRTPDANGKSPVFRREAQFGSTAYAVNNYPEFEAFLSDRISDSSFGQARIIADNTQGLINNKLFESHKNQTFIISCESLQGNTSQPLTITVTTGGTK